MHDSLKQYNTHRNEDKPRKSIDNGIFLYSYLYIVSNTFLEWFNEFAFIILDKNWIFTGKSVLPNHNNEHFTRDNKGRERKIAQHQKL